MATPLEYVRDYLAHESDVNLAYVFGSMAKGNAKYQSDLDIAIQTITPLSASRKMEMIAELANIAGRPVDLVDVNQAGEPLLGEILRDGKRLKGSDSQHVALIQRHIYNTEDFLPAIRRLLSERRQQWIS
jgi:predicted nucleotidyltransferase